MKTRTIDTILKLFDVTREEAESYATEFIGFVEAKGGVVSPSVIETQIPKILGKRLKWRNEKVKKEQEEKIQSVEKSYKNYLSNKKKVKW